MTSSFRTNTFVIRLAILALTFLTAPFSVIAQNRPALTAPERYRLQTGDVIEVQYRYTPEFNDTVTVQPDGFVTLPVVGDVKVGGLTVEQALAALLEKARVKFKDPELSLKLKEFERPFISVFGEVEKPGRLELHGTMTAVEALAAAGGLKDSAKHSQVVLFRKIDAEWAEAKEMDMKEGLAKRNLSEDLRLRPGDLLYVPKNKISKVERVMRIVNLGYPLTLLLRR
jgi:polysaccharide export outer membrane protein